MLCDEPLLVREHRQFRVGWRACDREMHGLNQIQISEKCRAEFTGRVEFTPLRPAPGGVDAASGVGEERLWRVPKETSFSTSALSRAGSGVAGAAWAGVPVWAGAASSRAHRATLSFLPSFPRSRE
jgi:hypothetical protein